jgi:hypothetical protein
MPLKINPNSYLLFSNYVDVDGVAFWELPSIPEMLPQRDDIFVTIGQGQLGQTISSEEHLRIDLLSFRVYRTPHLWWAIAKRNNFEIVPSELKVNQTIICPSPRYLYQDYLPKARR